MNDDALVWFRRDLREHDQRALRQALAAPRRVHCAFVFDTEILDALPSRADRRVAFIHASLAELDGALRRRGGGLVVRHGPARELIPRLARELGVRAVHANRDYEPQALSRDAAVARSLAAAGIAFELHKDQVVLAPDEVVKADASPYTVFTPYRNAWLRRVAEADLAACDSEPARGTLAAPAPGERLPGLADIGFEALDIASLRPGMSGAEALFGEFEQRIDDYHLRRDYPALDACSRLSVHLRFGTVSVRRLARHAWQRAHALASRGAERWLDELIWREFFQMILAHHPHSLTQAFRPEYAALSYEERPDWFAAWREGRTGYPLVDAAMRQLEATGEMHNRLRMLSASFLVKDLGVDWRLGERHFAQKLNDYELASNVGGWQWAASTGCDAQPYFRIFNPVTQSRRFDPDGAFIRRWLPQLAALDARRIHAPWLMDAGEQARAGVLIGRDYPPPLVDHARARLLTLARYERARRLSAGSAAARSGR